MASSTSFSEILWLLQRPSGEILWLLPFIMINEHEKVTGEITNMTNMSIII